MMHPIYLRVSRLMSKGTPTTVEAVIDHFPKPQKQKNGNQKDNRYDKVVHIQYGGLRLDKYDKWDG